MAVQLGEFIRGMVGRSPDDIRTSRAYLNATAELARSRARRSGSNDDATSEDGSSTTGSPPLPLPMRTQTPPPFIFHAFPVNHPPALQYHSEITPTVVASGDNISSGVTVAEHLSAAAVAEEEAKAMHTARQYQEAAALYQDALNHLFYAAAAATGAFEDNP